MKKAYLFTLFSLILIFTLLIFAGCKKNENISSISLKGYTSDSVIETSIGSFDYDAYTLLVSYDSGSTEEVTLTEEMISEADLFKFYQEGEHDITVSYNNMSYTFKIFVNRLTFGTLSFSKNNVFTYDGEEHGVDVEGDIPANAIVTYTGGNRFVNAGIYDVTAIVSCEGYVTQKLSTTVTIERAKYDMSGIKFESKEFVYDGQSHSIEISGELPEGVSAPTYSINGNTISNVADVGEYTVRATFANSNSNYETIPDMEAKLKITPAEYLIKGVDIVFKKEGGKLIDGNQKVYDGLGVTFDLNDYSKLSKKVSVSFSVYDKDGKVISASNQITNIKNAGLYTVKAEFTMVDGKNYKPIAPIIREFEVLQEDYPELENIRFVSAQIEYDGKEHSINIDGVLPEGVTVSYEYYLDERLVTDADGNPVQSVVDAGRYNVKAIFTHTDTNRKEITPISATLNIEPISINTVVMIPHDRSVVYDGTPKSVEMLGELPEYVEISYEYYLNEELVTNDDGTPATAVVEVGEYTVILKFTVTSPNYIPIEDKTILFVIVEENV